MKKNAKELLIFSWSVAQCGYQWIESKEVSVEIPRIHRAQAAKTRFLSTGRPFNERLLGTWYQPLKAHSGLFLDFARLDHTQPESLLKFANQYGLLGEVVNISLPENNQWADGEPYEIWMDEVETMQRAIKLWEMLRDGDQRGLAKFIRWKGKEGVRYQSEYVRGGIATPTLYPEWFKRFQPGQVARPAWFYLSIVINDHLSGRVSPQVVWERSQERLPKGPLDLYFMPNNLIGALWLQFAQAVAGGRKYRQCQHCGKPFVLAPDTARTNRRNCSDSCKTLASRKRNEGKKLIRRRVEGIKTTRAA